MGIENKYDVAVAGYTCIDLTPEFRKGKQASIGEILKPGQLTEIEGISFLPGGAVPNTGMALKKFNKLVYLNGLVGDDFIGTALIEWLGKCGLTEGLLITEKEGTAFSIVIAPPGVDRIFLEAVGCNKIFDTSHIKYDIISRCRIFHFGYPPLLEQFYSNDGSQLEEMYAKVQESGSVTSLDFSLPDPDSKSARLNWKRILKRVLPMVDICTPSLEEAMQMVMNEEYARILSMSGDTDIIDQIPEDMVREIGRRFLSYGVKILLIKAAHRGAYLLTGDISTINNKLGNTLDEEHWAHSELWCHARQVEQSKMKNATGAGDTAIAAFLSAILDGNGPDKTLKYTVLAGRNNLYCNNIYEELDSWEEMTEEITDGKDIIIDYNKPRK